MSKVSTLECKQIVWGLRDFCLWYNCSGILFMIFVLYKSFWIKYSLFTTNLKTWIRCNSIVYIKNVIRNGRWHNLLCLLSNSVFFFINIICVRNNVVKLYHSCINYHATQCLALSMTDGLCVFVCMRVCLINGVCVYACVSDQWCVCMCVLWLVM